MHDRARVTGTIRQGGYRACMIGPGLQVLLGLRSGLSPLRRCCQDGGRSVGSGTAGTAGTRGRGGLQRQHRLLGPLLRVRVRARLSGMVRGVPCPPVAPMVRGVTCPSNGMAHIYSILPHTYIYHLTPHMCYHITPHIYITFKAWHIYVGGKMMTHIQGMAYICGG